jgi:hypothetical protein
VDNDQAEADLHYWQIERFLELGYPRHLAEVLDLARVDWHELEVLLEADCSHELALEILT